MAIITLLTDFGSQDEYVGVLKGAILTVCPTCTIVDLNHQVPPQDIFGAGHMLRASYGYFPEGSLHAAIVDPGVGTGRAILAARYKTHFFLAPDNGLLPLVWADELPDEVVRVENQALYGLPVSRTFHGRDIFAPVAAHMVMGTHLQNLGRPMALTQVHKLNNPDVVYDQQGWLAGQIVSIDRFGNLITNIEIRHLDQLQSDGAVDEFVTVVGNQHITGLSKHYAEGADNEPMALIGSRNCLEIAVNCGSAAKLLQAGPGNLVRVRATT